MTKVLNWRQFLIPAEKGGGSLSCAVSGKSDGSICGLLRVGKSSDTTVVMRSAKPGAPLEVHAVHCSPSGCETAKPLRPISGRPNRYRVPVTGAVIDITRPSPTRMSVAVQDGTSSHPHILQYYGDRNLVTMGDEATAPSLMRGGSKLRVGRSYGYGMFAVEDIKAGEVVEEAPVLMQAIPFLVDYTFSAAGKHILPLGNIALYNHADQPTCAHSLDAEGSVMTLTATRDIRAGEEMSISYGPGYFLARGMHAQPVSTDSAAI